LGSSHWNEGLWFTALLQEAVEKNKGRKETEVWKKL
jgi:hypothetical protein